MGSVVPLSRSLTRSLDVLRMELGLVLVMASEVLLVTGDYCPRLAKRSEERLQWWEFHSDLAPYHDRIREAAIQAGIIEAVWILSAGERPSSDAIRDLIKARASIYEFLHELATWQFDLKNGRSHPRLPRARVSRAQGSSEET